MSTSRINFKQLRQENLKRTFAAFERAFSKLNIGFYLIGALARDTWFAGKGIRALGTKDIDLAVLVSDSSRYDALKKYLVDKEKFSLTTNEYTLLDPQGYEVDLFPFGNLHIDGRKIIDKEGLTHKNVSGFQEVYEEATRDVSFESKYNFRVASLAGIVVLKLIAWDDRPEIRGDDIVDVAIIINHYFELEENLIYDQHVDLFTQDFYDLKILSARALGREIQLILLKSELLRSRVVDILKGKKEDIHRKFLGVLVDEDIPGLPDYCGAILQAIITGIEENKQA